MLCNISIVITINHAALKSTTTICVVIESRVEYYVINRNQLGTPECPLSLNNKLTRFLATGARREAVDTNILRVIGLVSGRDLWKSQEIHTISGLLEQPMADRHD